MTYRRDGPLDGTKALVLAPHTDDGEIGCGGTISRLLREGWTVYYVAFSAAEASVPAGFPSAILREEVLDATATLGISKDNVDVLDFPVRQFLNHRQDILDKMIQMRDRLKPSLVLTPTTYDVHQDHQVITAEAIRAFRASSILGYEEPWNNLTFTTNGFVTLSDEDVQTKVAAMRCYRSQSGRPYFHPEFVTSWARTRGIQVGRRFAEAFEVIRWHIL